MNADSTQDPAGRARAANGQDGRGAAGEDRGSPWPEWEVAVAGGPACLRATAPRFRVCARNPARAALAALRRRGLDGPGARAAGIWIAVHLLPDAGAPRAVYAMGGTADAPSLELRWADLLPATSPLRGPGGPFDAAAVQREIPRTARRLAQRRIGSTGLRELVSGAFWRREATLYSSTALVLSALGFPMSDGVFVVGGVLLLLQGAVRLGLHEIRVAAGARRMRADPDAAGLLHDGALRALFARSHDLAGPDGEPRPGVLRAQAAVPALQGERRLRLLVDEDAAVATGGPDGVGLIAGESGFELPRSDNLLTVVFRRPRRPELPEQAHPVDRPAPPGSNGRPAGGLPVPVDGRDMPRDDDVEVIEAELLDPEAYWGGRRDRDWWA